MIERQFVNQKRKAQQIQEYIESQFNKTGYSRTEIKRTPLGEKIIIFTSRPGIVVGRKGENIKRLTETLKTKYKMENPQIEIGEIENPFIDANSIADKIAYTLERFGSKRFKSTGYKTLQTIMDAGALGAEIVISGKVPSARAKTWRFSAGYLKKSGDISENFVQRAYKTANLKTGTIGIKISIMPPDLKLPDKISIIDKEIIVEEQPKKEVKEKKPKKTNKEKPKKKDFKKGNKEEKQKENGDNKKK
jgi:small subunit ribosomal protein S3